MVCEERLKKGCKHDVYFFMVKKETAFFNESQDICYPYYFISLLPFY